MRRRRRLRRYSRYNVGEKKAGRRKIILRVLFVILCIAVLTAFSIMLGNRLKTRSTELESIIDDMNNQSETDTYADETLPEPQPATDTVKVMGEWIDILHGTPDDMRSDIKELSGSGFDSVVIDITDEGGSLVYTSDALLGLVGAAPDGGGTASWETEELTDETGDDRSQRSDAGDVLKNIETVISAAHNNGVTVTAKYTASAQTLDKTDGGAFHRTVITAVAKEISSLGADELMIDGLIVGTDLSTETVEAASSFIYSIQSQTEDLRVGMCMSSDVYLVSKNMSKIKTLSEYADFLSIKITSAGKTYDEAYTTTNASLFQIKGSFQSFNLRAYVSSSDETVVRAVYTALCELSIDNMQFGSYFGELKRSDEDGTDTSAEQDTVYSNPNASRSEDYQTSEEDGQGE